MASPTYTPPPVEDVEISFPRPHILLVTYNRPKQLNSIRRCMHPQLHHLWDWYDATPSLRCAIVTGRGRAFCAGADLKEWDSKNQDGGADKKSAQDREASWAESGFGGLSNRRGKKPIVAAVNGLCLGGAMEMVLNVDMVVAVEAAKFGLPEVSRGVVAIAGALPRLMKIVGRQRASEMAMLGRMYAAEDMYRWGIVNHIVKTPAAVAAGKDTAKVEAAVVDEAIKWAEEVVNNSPDSVIVSREGLLGGWEAEEPRASTRRIDEGIYRRLDGGENMKEGVMSFVEKRKPVWKDSKL